MPLNIISPDISHKSDQGGVILGVSSISEAEKALEKIKKAGGKAFSSVCVQMILGGPEFISGAKRGPAFGPVVLFGLGESTWRF